MLTAQLPLMEWSQIKSELIEMWNVARDIAELEVRVHYWTLANHSANLYQT